ncbi:MAG: hypothetical protein WC966_09735, partial [Bradymonadales bacterium]
WNKMAEKSLSDEELRALLEESNKIIEEPLNSDSLHDVDSLAPSETENAKIQSEHEQMLEYDANQLLNEDDLAQKAIAQENKEFDIIDIDEL